MNHFILSAMIIHQKAILLRFYFVYSKEKYTVGMSA